MSGFAVAPMLDWTTKTCRIFHRLLTRHAWLYTEMVTTGAILYGKNLPRFLGHDPVDCPVALQLGGSDPQALAECARLAQEHGYNAVNLNVGCPSDRVQNNLIGACLMAHPQRVAECVDAMKQAVDIPVTVKHRIGIDEQESYGQLAQFVAALDSKGVDGVIIHARKAWLQGLSPKENRDIPPLNYDWVHQIKQDFADLGVMINGGIKTPQQGLAHLTGSSEYSGVDGVMLGRAVYEQPYLLTQVDAFYYQDERPAPSREHLVQNLMPYIEQHLSEGGRLTHFTRHMMGLYHGQPGGRMWRRYLSQNACLPTAGLEVIEQALQTVAQERARMEDGNAVS